MRLCERVVIRPAAVRRVRLIESTRTLPSWMSTLKLSVAAPSNGRKAQDVGPRINANARDF